MVTQNWIIDCLKIYKISGLSKIPCKTGEKIQRGIFLGDAQSPLLFLMVMVTLKHMLRKCTGENKLLKLQKKINHRMYMDDIKLLVKNEKNWKPTYR